jgi:hypothetical protein
MQLSQQAIRGFDIAYFGCGALPHPTRRFPPSAEEEVSLLRHHLGDNGPIRPSHRMPRFAKTRVERMLAEQGQALAVCQCRRAIAPTVHASSAIASIGALSDETLSTPSHPL